jgi:predicted glycoside hydrolase/deacetylase ChbG (UPF0249 family)
MKLIINADDYGLTDGICRSIIDLLEQDAISNTTIMICVDGAEKRCRLLKDTGFSSRAGVHLQTTLERHHKKPLSHPSEIPSLVDENGFFKSHECDDPINPDEIELEWERQIVKVSEILGHKPSHIDSHHGIHREPECTSVYLKLAAKYEIPVRGGRHIGQIDGSDIGVQSSTLCLSNWTGQNEPLSFLKSRIEEALPQVGDGVLEVVAHPGYLDDDLLKSSDWNSVRENDHDVLRQLAKSKWLKDNNIDLISFSELKRSHRQEKVTSL